MNIEQKYIDLFMKKVVVGPNCWRYLGAHCRDGYGQFGISKIGQFKAHRFMLMIQGQSIPQGMVVMHTCDNPGCVNPNHLRIGTIQENNLDKLQKNRQAKLKGMSNAYSKFTDNDIYKIRQDPRHYSEIAKDFSVNPETIRLIKKRKTWSHI